MRREDVDAAAAELFAEHEKALYRLARRYVGDERAREVVQDTFVRFLERREEAEGKLPQWLFAVCKNRAIDVARRETVRRAPVPGASPPSSAPVKLDVARALRAIGELPRRQREDRRDAPGRPARATARSPRRWGSPRATSAT